MGHLGTYCSINPVGSICYDDAKDSSVKFYVNASEMTNGIACSSTQSIALTSPYPGWTTYKYYIIFTKLNTTPVKNN